MLISRVERNSSRVATFMVVLLIVVLLSGTVLLQYSLDSSSATERSLKNSTPFDTGRSILDLLGGVRETLAAYFWTKTDVIHHTYYGEDITREQAFYPYFWLITKLDPHFTMAYYYASYMVCWFGKMDLGLNLALEGARNNPDSAILQENLSQIYLFFMKDPKRARDHILKAIQLSKDPADTVTYVKFLSTIDLIITGARKIPKIPSAGVTRRMLKRAD
jgi:hypothetical protein